MTPPRAYPGRDTARLVRRAASIRRHHAAPTNERARCCPAPEHVERRDEGRLVTECRNCGARV